MKPLTQNRGIQGVHLNFAALTLNPSPKREKGLGDEGKRAKLGYSQFNPCPLGRRIAK